MRFIVFVGLLLLAMNLTAAETVVGSVWEGKIGAGFVATSGNSDTSSINSKIDVTNESGKWRHNAKANALNNKAEGVRSAEKYFLAEKSDYKFTDNYYAFERVSYENDQFSGFDYQYTLTAGIGRRFLENNADMVLDVEAGAGLQGFRPELQQSESESLIRFSGKYVWSLSARSSFTQELSSEIGEQFTVLKSLTGLSAQLAGGFALDVSYSIKHTSDVPVGKEKTDTVTTINLVYSF